MSNPKRKLAAIVFTDIVGFTELSAKNEPAALELLNTQRELFKPIVRDHGGDWLKEIGDGLLLTFKTNREAVFCSIAMQEAAKAVKELQLRIGIHQGEVVFQGEDVAGDDVNIASRIEPYSPVGGIAISNRVNVSLERDPEFSTEIVGSPELKGVTQEVKIYCITSHGLSTSGKLKNKPNNSFKWNVLNVTGAVLSIIGILFWINISFLGVGNADDKDIVSIAILPFENKGSDQDDFYAYGISTDLITDVTSTGLIRVASLADIEKLDYNKISNNEISNKLLVRYVAKGTLWKMDSIFQLSMEIFDTELSKVVHANRWQTDWEDLGIIKDELSKNILESLNIDFLENVELELPESDPVAYEYYLRAKHLYNKRKNKDDTKITQELLSKAIDLDSNLVDARLLLGNTYNDLSDYDNALLIYKNARNISEKLGDKKGVVDCNKYIASVFWMTGELDSILAIHKISYQISKKINNKHHMSESLDNIGMSHLRKGNYDSTIIYSKRALELYRDLDDKEGIAETYNSIGSAYNFLGDYENSVEFRKKALEIYKEIGDEEQLSTSYLVLGWDYNQNGDHQSAIDNFEKSLELANSLDNKPRILGLYYNMAYSYTIAEDYASALDLYKTSIQMAEDLGNRNTLGYVLKDMGYHLYFNKMDLDSALHYISKANLIFDEVSNKHGQSRSLIQTGDIYRIMGDYDNSLKNYSAALDINVQEKRFSMGAYFRLGQIWFLKENYKKALKNLDKYVDLRKELLDKSPNLSALTLISLCKKKTGKQFDLRKIKQLIDDTDEIGYTTYFRLYKLLDDFQYLKYANEKIQDQGDKLEESLKKKFYDYPIPRQVIEYQKNINS